MGGQQLLDMRLVPGCCGTHALHPVRADDLLLDRPALPGAGGGRRGGLPGSSLTNWPC